MNSIYISNLRNVLRDVRGASVVSYAVVLGGLAVLLTYGVQQVSHAVTKSLSSQSSELKAIAADGSGAGGSSASNGSSGSSGSSGSGGSSGSSGGSGGKKGRR